MKTTIALLAACALVLTACGKTDPPPKPKTSDSTLTLPQAAGVTVNSVTLGNGISAQKKVVQSSEVFARNDTIYASVDTSGAGSATLKAKWTYRANGQDVPVREDTQAINPTGPATSEFHVSKPDGWPVGDYKVEVTTAAGPPSTRAFSVK